MQFDDESAGERDKGPLVYQESKHFHSEANLINVYDNSHKKFVTFEVYGLDTQGMLHISYEYPQFDNLFRFNAELMNPNRKDGRYHWIVERLEIQVAGGDKGTRKLKLGEKPTEEISQLPLYETVRKIPTGRMDLKERQRLREQMDMLDIRRAENIAAKRAKTKQRILKHIFQLKEDFIRKKEEQKEKMEEERSHRYKDKEAQEKKEEEELKLLEQKTKARRKAMESLEQMSEEQEEFELQELRRRWAAQDQEKERLIKSANDAREKNKQDEKSAQINLDKKRNDANNKRLSLWKARDGRVKAREDEWLKNIFEQKAERRRGEKMRKERNDEFIKDWDAQRQPIFAGQMARARERELARVAEDEAVKGYQEKRAVPKKPKTKGKKGGAAAKAAPKKEEAAKDDKPAEKPKKKKEGDADKKEKKKDDEEKSEKSAGKDVAAILDNVESKMRAEMAEEKRRAQLEKVREEKVAKLQKERTKRAMARLAEVRARHRTETDTVAQVFAERHLIMQQKESEMKAADVRKKQDIERLKRARDANIEAKEKKWLEKATKPE